MHIETGQEFFLPRPQKDFLPFVPIMVNFGSVEKGQKIYGLKPDGILQIQGIMALKKVLPSHSLLVFSGSRLDY